MIKKHLFKITLALSLFFLSSCTKKEGSISLVATKQFAEDHQSLFTNQQEIKYKSCFRMVTIIPISFGTNYDNTNKMVEEALNDANKKGIVGNVIINAKIKATMLLLPPIYGSICSILEGQIATLDKNKLSEIIAKR